MDVSGIRPQMGAMQNRYDNISSIDEAAGAASVSDVDKAVEDMQKDKGLESFQIFVRSGEIPEAQRFQENWMRPVENFML